MNLSPYAFAFAFSHLCSNDHLVPVSFLLHPLSEPLLALLLLVVVCSVDAAGGARRCDCKSMIASPGHQSRLTSYHQLPQKHRARQRTGPCPSIPSCPSMPLRWTLHPESRERPVGHRWGRGSSSFRGESLGRGQVQRP